MKSLYPLFMTGESCNRTQYFLGSLATTTVMIGAVAMMTIPGMETILAPLALLLCLVAVFCNLMLAINRTRDCGWSAWFLLLAIIPYAGVLFLLALFVCPTEERT